ncbi:MAG TPA: FixH family protein [Polyangiales bacterium]
MACVLGCSLAACGDEKKEAPANQPHDAAAHEPHEDDDVEPCPEDIPRFEPGMTVEGESKRLRARLVRASPVAPRKYENNWVLELLDASDQPIEIDDVEPEEPWMDAHGHGGGYEPDVTLLQEPGQVELDRINLFMPGPWRLNVNVKSKAGESDEIILHVCVP